MMQKPAKIENLMKVVHEFVKAGKYRETYHAQIRQQERRIFLTEILHVLSSGRHEKSKDAFDDAFLAWNYAIRGFTFDKKDMRVIVTFDEEVELLIITAFYIGKK